MPNLTAHYNIYIFNIDSDRQHAVHNGTTFIWYRVIENHSPIGIQGGLQKNRNFEKKKIY